MWLVLCERGDLAALWASRGLAARGLEPLEVVSADALAYALRWEHRLDSAGASVEVRLADGRTIGGGRVRGVLNRLVSLPDGHLAAAAPPDREYARQELSAFFLSWLNALPAPVLNRPTPHGLSGPWLRLSEWLALAHEAGLPTPAVRWGSSDGYDESRPERAPVRPPLVSVVVVDGGVVGRPVPPAVAAGCRRLAKLSGTDVLGVELGTGSARRWTFAAATPLPDLRVGGGRLLDRLAAALARSHEGG